jgi:glycolate dehydrogenase FAD-binding subunit
MNQQTGVAEVAPTSAEELATVLRQASAERTVVQVVGGGSRLGYGTPERPGLILRTGSFAGIESWDPEDLTVTVGSGTPIAVLESTLGERSQTAVLPEVPGASTVGGAISAGVSSLRRGRLLGTRERVLEVTLVTGDGRLIRAGGRVVKNVTGYDLPRLVVGAFGSLGVIVSVCLKLLPTPRHAVTVTVPDLETAKAVVRPLAVLDENGKLRIYLWGTPEEMVDSTARLGGEATEGHVWPADPQGLYRWSLRIPPASTQTAFARLPAGWRYLAIMGVGEVRLGSDGIDGAVDLRSWAETLGGALVMVDRPTGAPPGLDPWGTPPAALDLQRSLIEQFDPVRILNPGRLPGGI